MEIRDFNAELQDNILRFWLDNMKDPQGGFYGRMTGKAEMQEEADRGLILNARILWTFASAYRITRKEEYLHAAQWAKDYIMAHFVDSEYSGAYWSLACDGSVRDSKKQFYAIAFAVYGLSELYRASGDEDSLSAAISLYRSIEEHSHDTLKGGYIEACTRDWKPIEDMRLSEKDRNDAKTMNTHLHILEGYTSLYRVWKDESLKQNLHDLIELFLDRITASDGHLLLFFTEDWQCTSRMFSYGHDIEASWLIWEAVEVLGDDVLRSRARGICEHIAEASMQGFSSEGGMIYEFDPESGHLDKDRHWWVQAETVVGAYNMYQLTGDEKWLNTAQSCWKFIRENIICPDGEWYWSRRADGSANTDDDRAGFWKCPYHNGRMCMEMIERLS